MPNIHVTMQYFGKASVSSARPERPVFNRLGLEHKVDTIIGKNVTKTNEK